MKFYRYLLLMNYLVVVLIYLFLLTLENYNKTLDSLKQNYLFDFVIKFCTKLNSKIGTCVHI